MTYEGGIIGAMQPILSLRTKWSNTYNKLNKRGKKTFVYPAVVSYNCVGLHSVGTWWQANGPERIELQKSEDQSSASNSEWCISDDF